MSIFLTAPLDLSQLPAFQLVTVDYETERTNLINGIVARFQAAGITYDVQTLETDPAVVLAEEFAYRKTIDLQGINDAGKRLTLASSYGAALDHIAATYYADVGVARLPLVTTPRPYSTNPEDWESDDRFRKRIQLAPATRTAGTLESYEYFALTAAPYLIDAKAFNYASGLCQPGGIVVVVLGQQPNPNPSLDIPAQDEAAQLVLAQNLLMNRDTKQGTDIVSVRAATRVPVTISAVLGLPDGPDPSLVVTAATTAVTAYAKDCASNIGRELTESGQKASLYVGAVRRVRLTGAPDDVDPGLTGVILPTIGSIATESFGG